MRQRDFDMCKRLHKELWMWISEGYDREKCDWPKWKSNRGKVNNVQNNCFGCKVDDDSNQFGVCSGCPIDSSKYNCRLCGTSSSPFSKWDNAMTKKTKSKWAKIIAELPWIKR